MNDQLAPGFLLAPPSLLGSLFERSVVLLAAHDDDGSMGFIINKRADRTLHELLADLEIEPQVPDQAVLVGGPVSEISGFVLYRHEDDEPLAPGLTVLPTLSLTPSREVLMKAAAGELGQPFELIMGYAGWAPGQLEAELQRGGWLHADFDAEILAGAGYDARWEDTYKILGVSPATVIDVPGGAQA